MSKLSSLLIKLVFFNAFFTYQFYKFVSNGIIEFEYIFSENTVGKYTIYITYGFISIMLDNLFIKNKWTDLNIVRYKTKVQWFFSILKEFVFIHLSTILGVVCLLVFNFVLYGLEVDFTYQCFNCLLTLLLFLIMLSSTTIMVMSITRKPNVAIFFTFIINILFMVIGKRSFAIEDHLMSYIMIFGVLIFVFLFISGIFIDKRDLYMTKTLKSIF